MAGVLELIWVSGEAEYFLQRDWTAKSLICPSGKISGRVGWVEPLAKPIAVVQSMMGIASLNPSYALPVIARSDLSAVAQRAKAVSDEAIQYVIPGWCVSFTAS
jgi:hypothetical protein